MLTVMLKLNHRKKCIQLLTFLLIFSLMISVGAACLRPQIVCASVAGTIAGYILTLFASFNTAITNPQVVNAINNTFGQMSMIEADAAAIDQGIASIAASTGFDMASVFANTAEEAAQVIASAPTGSALEGAEAIAATAGVNIAAGASACAASATGTVLPAIGGLVLPALGAVALGVAGGVLIGHIRNTINRNIQLGLSLDTPQSVINSIPSNVSSFVLFEHGNKAYRYYSSGDFYCAYWNATENGNKVCRYRIYNLNNNDIYVQEQVKSGDNWNNRWGNYIGPNRSTSFADTVYNDNIHFSGGNEFSNGSDADSYVRNNKDKLKNKYSPDVVGQTGNQSGVYDNGNFTTPNIYPVYNYGNTVINYINPTDYNTFVQAANQNTADGLTDEDTQGNYFDTFVNPYIQPVEQNPENPDPENPNPEHRPTVPYPDPEEYPDAIPEVNPVPDTDIAPTAIPYPELPEPTDEEITETNDKITPFDLKNKFPFCLPFDIHKALLKLKGARESPYFVWQIPFGDAGQQTVTVDLSAWDDVASILRLLELLLFIVGLAVATRNLIGGT